MPSVRLTDKAVQAVRADPGQRVELWDLQCPGLCLRVSGTDKGQTKVWVWRYRTIDGRQPRLKLGEYSSKYGLAEARADADLHRVAVRSGVDPAGDAKKKRHAAKTQPIKTFNDLATTYFAACERGEWKPKGKLKRKITIDGECEMLRLHVTPVIGELRLEEITRPLVKNLLRQLIAKGLTTRVNRTQAVVRQIFAFAIAEERVSINPATGFSPLADEKPRARVLSDAELKAVWQGLLRPGLLRIGEGAKAEKVSMSRPMAIALQLSLLLLQRRQEISGMAVSELNLEAGTWLIPAERMKGGAPHLVPLPAKAVELIQEALRLRRSIQDEAGDVYDSPWVFPGRDPRKPTRADSLSHATDKLFKALKVEKASLHDVRRTGSTTLTSERLAIPPFIRSKVLGHRSDAGGGSAVSMIHYDANEYVSEKRRALDAWASLLLEIVGERAASGNVTRFVAA